jgi:hypothetical protein
MVPQKSLIGSDNLASLSANSPCKPKMQSCWWSQLTHAAASGIQRLLGSSASVTLVVFHPDRRQFKPQIQLTHGSIGHTGFALLCISPKVRRKLRGDHFLLASVYGPEPNGRLGRSCICTGKRLDYSGRSTLAAIRETWHAERWY